jgi:hypothetical protein
MTMKKSVLFAIASLIALGTATPSFANDAVNGVASVLGSTAATIVDVPQGIIVDSLWRMPLKTWHTLADKFGDDKGFQQNVCGAVIGIPVGFLWGIPEGAIRGGHHGMTTGWEKPFSTDSFLCLQEEK